jgi:hypothetical protein
MPKKQAKTKDKVKDAEGSTVRTIQPGKTYLVDPDKLEEFLQSINTPDLTDPQKCGHILTFFQQQGIIKHTNFDPRDQYVRDQNAALTDRGGSIDNRSSERRQS